MEKNTPTTEKNNSPMFAFLPEMVLDHLSNAILKDSSEDSNTPVEDKTTIPVESKATIAEPLIKPVEKELKNIEATTASNLEIANGTTQENTIIWFLKNIKSYFFPLSN